MEDLKQIQEFFSKPLNEDTFKVGQKVTYLGHPAVVTATKEYNGRNFVSVSYDKGTGKTKASNILVKSGDVKPLEEGTLTPDDLASYRDNAMEKLANADIIDKKLGKTRQGDKYIMIMYKEKWDFANPPKTGMYNPETQWVKVFYNDESEIQDLIALKETKVVKEGKQLDQVDFAKVVKAVEQTGHPVTVLLVPKFNEIEVITGMDAPDDMLRDLSDAVDSLGYGHNDIIIAGDSSNLSRREYSDIRRVNGGAKDYFEESLNEVKRPEPNYKELVKLLIMAFKHEPKSRFYFNRNNGVVYFDLIGGAAYSPKKSKMRDIFGGMSPIAVNREFGRADHYEEETIKQVEQLSNGKIKAEIKELGDGVLYKLASVNEQVANINRHIKAIQIQLDQLGVKYEMSDNPRKPFKAVYKPINKDDKWYDNFEDIIFRYNLGGVVKTAINELDIKTYRSAVEKGLGRGDDKGREIAQKAIELMGKSLSKELKDVTLVIKPIKIEPFHRNYFSGKPPMTGQYQIKFSGEGNLHKPDLNLDTKDITLFVKAKIGKAEEYGGWSSPVELDRYTGWKPITLQLSIRNGSVEVYPYSGGGQVQFTRQGARLIAKIAKEINLSMGGDGDVRHNAIKQFTPHKNEESVKENSRFEKRLAKMAADEKEKRAKSPSYAAASKLDVDVEDFIEKGQSYGEFKKRLDKLKEDKKLTYSDFVDIVRADMRAGATSDENASENQIKRVARWKYDDYLKGISVDDLFEATKEEYNALLDKEHELTKAYSKDKTDANWKKLSDIRKKGKKLEKELEDQGLLEASKEEENEFHKKLDKLVHKTFGHSSDEKKEMEEYNTGLDYHPNKDTIRPKIKQASKSGLEKVKDMIQKIMKEELSDYEEKEADYDKLYSDYLYKMVKEVATEKGYSKFLVSKDNPKGETDGLTPDVLNKILMNVVKDIKETNQIDEGASTEEKRIAMSAIKRIAKYRGVGEDEARNDLIRAAKELGSLKEAVKEIFETIELGQNLNEELCPKGKAYIKKRQAAGEKSSAYLSGRAVKVCKGQMKG